MDITEYAKENFFTFRVDIPSVEYAKRFLEERGSPRKDKELVIIIPDRNEDPEALRSTVIQLAMSNILTSIFQQIDKDRFSIKKIVVSDQSDDAIARTNRGLLYTVKDVLSNTMGETVIPGLYHFHFDTEITDIVYEYLRDYIKMSRKEKGIPILGKGINMAISSLVSSELTEAGILDQDTVLVFMDAENKEINYKDPFLLGAPLIYIDSPYLFSKAAFRRYHMEGERRKLGGRVNASLGVPLISMLIYRGLIPIKKPISYPLSGEIGINRELFWSINIAKQFGVEMTTLLQLLGRDNHGETKLTQESFLQVDLGINMDQPLAEGKSPREVLRGVRKMSGDIISATFQIMGEQIREAWGSQNEFMNMFAEFQKYSMERWMQSHDRKDITGGVTHNELRSTVYSVIEDSANSFFSEETVMKRTWRKMKDIIHHSEEGFVPPINKIRDDMGDTFDTLREKLINKKERLYP